MNITKASLPIQQDALALSANEMITFDSSLNTSDAIQAIDAILQIEKASNFQEDFKLNLKLLAQETKIEVLKKCLLNKDICNSTIMFNIINLIKCYNQLQDSFFSAQQVIFESLLDFLDIKQALEKEIQDYITQLSKWYFSIFQSIHKVERNFLDQTREMPNSFLKIISTLDFFTMSGIISKSNNFNTEELFVVDNASSILHFLSIKNNMTNKFLDEVSNFFKIDDKNDLGKQ